MKCKDVCLLHFYLHFVFILSLEIAILYFLQCWWSAVEHYLLHTVLNMLPQPKTFRLQWVLSIFISVLYYTIVSYEKTVDLQDHNKEATHLCFLILFFIIKKGVFGDKLMVMFLISQSFLSSFYPRIQWLVPKYSVISCRTGLVSGREWSQFPVDQ